MTQAIASCQSVCKTFGQGDLAVHALRDINLELMQGDFATLAGPSGSGKSTLLNVIGALDTPSAGTVVVAGQDLSQLNANGLSDLRLHQVGFVFQAFNLVPVLSAIENIEFVLELQGVTPQERRERALNMLAEVGLKGLEHRRPSALSGGQQQRVAVARALVSQPSIVLADEPTANLDSKATEELMSLMYRLNQERGTTFIIGTHDPRVMQHSKRHIELLDGRIDSDARR